MKVSALKFLLCLALGNFAETYVTAQLEKDHVIQFFAHRGSRKEFDENTMKAFKATYEAGIRGYETDIRMTKDGDLILSHDESLKRTCGIDKMTEDLTNKEIRKIRTKEGNPLVFAKELEKYLRDKDGMYVEWEIKTIPELYDEKKLEVLCDKLYKLVMPKKPKNSEYLFTSFDRRALKIMKRQHPDAILMMLEGKPCSKEIIAEAKSLDIDRVGCVMDGTTRDIVKYGHEQGMIVSLWPGYGKEDFLLGVSLGCDAMCCDKALEVAQWRQDKMPFIKIKGVQNFKTSEKSKPGTGLDREDRQNQVVTLIGHRGGRYEFDENTMEAFEGSYNAGVRGYETDLHLTKDGEIVINHDYATKSRYGKDLEIEQSTLEEINALRTAAGNKMPTLKELIKFFNEKTGLYVEFEMKTDEKHYSQAMLDELCEKAYQLIYPNKPKDATYIFSSFDVRSLKTMKRLHPDAEIMYLTGNPWTMKLKKELDELGTKRVACGLNGTKREDVMKAHKEGLILNLWPVRTKEDFCLAVAVGADVFCLDSPIEMIAWQKEAFSYIKVK